MDRQIGIKYFNAYWWMPIHQIQMTNSYAIQIYGRTLWFPLFGNHDWDPWKMSPNVYFFSIQLSISTDQQIIFLISKYLPINKSVFVA